LDDYELPLLRTSKDWVRLKERLYLLESYLAGMVVETYLELIKNTFPAEDIKSNSKTFRKPNWSSDLKFTKAKHKIVEIGRNVAAVSDYNHLEPAILKIDAHTLCCLNMENAKHCP